jgi:hypothetical protein
MGLLLSLLLSLMLAGGWAHEFEGKLVRKFGGTYRWKT